MNDIGQRVKNFRKAKGLTQQELELEIGAACGHISRIESGQINPTKETLLRIGEVLKLNEKEINSLLGLQPKPVSQEEIQAAIKASQPYLDSSPYPAYLACDHFFVHNWNKKMLDFLGVDPEYAKPFRGTHMLEILFNPDLEFRKAIPKNRWKQIGIDELNFFLRLANYGGYRHEKWFLELIKSLKRHKDFPEFWEFVCDNFQEEILPRENLIYFQKDGQEVCFYMSVIKVGSCPRFQIVEYIPHK